jgi:hypothetical protein
LNGPSGLAFGGAFGGEELLEKGYTIRGRKKSEEGLLALPLIIVSSVVESRTNYDLDNHVRVIYRVGMESCVTLEVRACSVLPAMNLKIFLCAAHDDIPLRNFAYCN